MFIKITGLGIPAGILLLGGATALADIAIEQKIDVSGGGSYAAFSSTGTVKTYVSGDKSRTESKMESQSKLLGSLMTDQDNWTINRLDLDQIYQLIPKKQQYSVMTYEQLQAQMDQAKAQMGKLQSGQGSTLPVSEEECQWSGSKFDVLSPGTKKRFANVKAEQHIITVEETCTVPSSGQTCVMTWILENWMAKRMPGDDELMAFNQALAAKLGTDEWASGFGASSSGLTSMFNEGWEEALEEAGELKGYPVKTVMTMKMGGEQCTSQAGDPIAMDEVWGNALDAGVESGANTAGSHAGRAVSREAAEAAGGGVGGSVAGSAVGAASSEVISGMLKHFGKKKKKPAPPPEEQVEVEAGPPAAAVLFQISTELTGASEKRIDSLLFDEPVSWEKL